jgi:hypothetical protein
MDELERQLNEIIRDIQQRNERELLAIIDALNQVIEALSMRIGTMLTQPREEWNAADIKKQLEGAHELRHGLGMMLQGMGFTGDDND